MPTFNQEILHINTKCIWVKEVSEQLIPDTPDYDAFQSAENPADLGFTFVEHLKERIERDTIKFLTDPRP